MTTQHTPGPWRVDNTVNHHPVVEGDNGETWESKMIWIKDINGKVLGEAISMTTTQFNPDINKVEANARLIAAAPELLESLKTFMAYYETDFFHLGANDGRTLSEWVTKANKVISKATNQTADV
jgi:hypothetical protein